MLEVYDMVKELGYNGSVEMYFQEPCGILKLTPLKTDYDVLSMLADLTDRNAEIERTFFSETVRNAETVRTDFSESEDEDANYVASESEHSDSPFEDSENDIVDEVCDMPVEVGRDIHGFTVGSNEETDEETDSEAETESLHSESDSETERKKRRFPKFNSGVDIENPQFRKCLLFPDQKVIKTAVKQYAVKNRHNLRLKVNDSARLQVVCKDGCPWMIWASRLNPKDSNDNTW
ncbi:hypothetical protein V6N13_053290 [Hibiscus sabdariffa]